MHFDPRFGNIEFNVSLKARSIRVRILTDGLKVSLPAGCSERKALEFINSSTDAIIRKQNKLKSAKKDNVLIICESNNIKTLSFEIFFKKTDRKDIFFSFKNGLLTIEFPENSDHTNAESQKKCWKGINYFLKKEANRLLPERTKHLAATHGFIYSAAKIQTSRTRWGSCSRFKSINLSCFLMLLPSHLIDYVILHELCHTRQMNHGDKFWNEMDKVTQNRSKLLRKELKSYQIPGI